MTRFGLLLVIALWPLVGTAAPLQVRTGEHPNFTRVVISIPRGVEWQLGRTSEGYALRIPAAEGFVLNDFFDLIPKDRIAAVSQVADRGELRLRIGCTCYAQASVYGSDSLVIDINDGPVPQNAAFEQALPDDMRSAPVDLPKSPYRPDPNRLLPFITPRMAMQQAVSPGETATTTEVVAAEVVSQTMDQSEADKALQMIVQSLTESLGRGLTEGFLQAGAGPKDPNATSAERIDPLPKHTDDALPGVSARTSIDPMAVPSAAGALQTQTGETCLPNSMFDVASWGSGRPPHEQLTDARNRLVDPADKFQDGALLALARLYVFLGFGREAEQVLELEGVQSRERLMLRTIARIIDDEPVAQALFTGQVSCAANVALWALLAQESAPSDASVDRTGVINAFRALPIFVQQPIAPRLAEALLAVGAQDEAMQVLGRGGTPDQTDISRVLAEASLMDALGEEAQAIDTITSAARNTPRTSPEALTRFFLNGVEAGVGFSDQDFILADGLRFENAETQVADHLAEAQFHAYLSVDRFADARRLLAARLDRLAMQELVEDRADLFGQAVERMPDTAFLEFIWQEDLQVLDAVSQMRVAERLVELGFPDRALSVLSAAWEGEMEAQRNSLRLLARQRIAAMQRSRGDILTRLDTEQPPVVESVGETMVLTASSDPTLRNNRALVDDAVQSRERIRALLQSVPAPAGY